MPNLPTRGDLHLKRKCFHAAFGCLFACVIFELLHRGAARLTLPLRYLRARDPSPAFVFQLAAVVLVFCVGECVLHPSSPVLFQSNLPRSKSVLSRGLQVLSLEFPLLQRIPTHHFWSSHARTRANTGATTFVPFSSLFFTIVPPLTRANTMRFVAPLLLRPFNK